MVFSFTPLLSIIWPVQILFCKWLYGFQIPSSIVWPVQILVCEWLYGFQIRSSIVWPVQILVCEWLYGFQLHFSTVWLVQIPDYRNAVIVARNPNSVKRATSYAERLRLSIAVIHGHGEERIPESEEDDGRNSPPIHETELRPNPSTSSLEILPGMQSSFNCTSVVYCFINHCNFFFWRGVELGLDSFETKPPSLSHYAMVCIRPASQVNNLNINISWRICV